jgi:hypothetical protein
MIDIRSHSRDHVCETNSFREIGDDLMAFNAGILILVNDKRFNEYEDLGYVGTSQGIEFIEYLINSLRE